jgi:hypothetical protein
MSKKVSPYYSINEVKKLPKDRVHHNDDDCPAGKQIPKRERIDNSTGGYRLCEDCPKTR